MAHQIERHLTEAMPDLEVTIHMEPIDEHTSWEEAELAKLGEPTAPTMLPQK
jgi:divalent metal cation (Fe/Co/Zn/Cd) transporter